MAISHYHNRYARQDIKSVTSAVRLLVSGKIANPDRWILLRSRGQLRDQTSRPAQCVMTIPPGPNELDPAKGL